MSAGQEDRTREDAPAAEDDVVEGAEHEELEELVDDPDDVPEVNAWLTIAMFAFFVLATVGCYIWLDGWH